MSLAENTSHRSTRIIIRLIEHIHHQGITALLQDRIHPHLEVQGIIEVPAVHIAQEGGDNLE